MGKVIAAFFAGVLVTGLVAVAVLYALDLEVVDRDGDSSSTDVAKATVPQVVGMPIPAARNAVEGAGLSPRVFNQDKFDFSSYMPTRVVAQTPEAGTQVEEGTVVGIDAGQG